MEISGEGDCSFPESMLRRDMFLEGRLWQLGFETEQMRRARDFGDRQVTGTQGPGGGWSIYTPRKGIVTAGLEQD